MKRSFAQNDGDLLFSHEKRSMQNVHFRRLNGVDYSPSLYSLQEDEKNSKMYMIFLISVLKWIESKGEVMLFRIPTPI